MKIRNGWQNGTENENVNECRAKHIIFCHLIVYLRPSCRSKAWLDTFPALHLGEQSSSLVFVLLALAMFGLCITCWFWLTVVQFNFPAVAHVTQFQNDKRKRCFSHIQNKHLTKGHTSHTFDKLIDAAQFFFLFSQRLQCFCHFYRTTCRTSLSMYKFFFLP